MVAARNSSTYRPDIDGLRAIAVTSVVAYHAGIWPLTGGFAGVDVFFVISGYLITSLINREIRSGSFSFIQFYARRCRRILPALLALLVVVMIGALLLLSVGELKRFSASVIATLAAASNVFFWWTTDYFAPNADQNLLLMTWSLGVEEQFYVLFPLLLLVLSRFSARTSFYTVLAISLASFAASVVVTRLYPSFAFYLLPTRAWELGAGSALALLQSSRGDAPAMPRWVAETLSLAGLAAVVAALVGFTELTPFPGYAAALPVAGATLLIVSRGSLVNERLLSSKPFVAVGLVSYSWYLWHWPLLSFAHVLADGELAPGVAPALAGASFVCATLSYFLVERPFRRPGLSERAAVARYGALLAAGAACCLAIYVTQGLPQRFTPEVAAIERASETPQAACLTNYGSSALNAGPGCLSLTPGTKAIALIGDSHAAAIAPSLRQAAEQAGYGFVALTKASCPALADLSRYMPNHPQHAAECLKYAQAAFRFIEAHPEITAAALVGYWSAPIREAELGSRYVAPDLRAPEDASANLETLRSGLAASVTRLQKLGKQVYVFQDVPLLEFNPVRRYFAMMMPLRGKLASFAQADRTMAEGAPTDLPDPARDAVAEAVRSTPGAILVDPRESLCGAGACRYATEEGTLYVDPQHLSALGARTVIGAAALFPRYAQDASSR